MGSLGVKIDCSFPGVGRIKTENDIRMPTKKSESKKPANYMVLTTT